MANQTVDFYSIRTLTNLHAGSGDTTYGIVDNMVQRDPSSEIPVIHASSLKGALRQHFRELLGTEKYTITTENGSEIEKERDKSEIVGIFGGDTSPREKGASGNDFSAGSHLFLEARLLVLPVRSDRRQFYRAVCPELIQETLDMWKAIGYESNIYLRKAFQFLAGKEKEIRLSVDQGVPKILVKNEEKGSFGVDEWEVTDKNIIQITATFKDDDGNDSIDYLENAEMVFGSNIALFHIDDFKALCRKLPVIARNQLNNGISENLFYEEVVPRESRFFTFVIRPENDNSFVSRIKDVRVQVGANATVGYGQCKFVRYASQSKLIPQIPKPA